MQRLVVCLPLSLNYYLDTRGDLRLFLLRKTKCTVALWHRGAGLAQPHRLTTRIRITDVVSALDDREHIKAGYFRVETLDSVD